ncbi:hypothetical protein BDQ17DRAFT_1434487 [Cyathus striatus]|nr:hypothetical protein BDQ17DRAFT_1434487 [Cyathus striatus]
MSVFDQQTLTKVTTIGAPKPRTANSPPHVQVIEELYQAFRRPTPTIVNSAPPFEQCLPQVPASTESVKGQMEKPQAVKAAEAYKPPGARGLGGAESEEEWEKLLLLMLRLVWMVHWMLLRRR